MSPEKPFAPACERNQQVIHQILRKSLATRCEIFEIASGTGQHAVYCCARQAHWHWQCSDLAENLAGLQLWLQELNSPLCPPAIPLDVTQDRWPAQQYDAVFTSNSLHIMPWPAVESLFQHLPGVLRRQGKLLIYGPFNYAGRYTSSSNAEFDRQLKSANPQRGIRDFEAVEALADAQGLYLHADFEMPANNRTLVFQCR